jgi:hypothetical protein
MLSEDALVVLGNGHSLTHLFRHLHHLLRSCLYFSVLKDFCRVHVSGIERCVVDERENNRFQWN